MNEDHENKHQDSLEDAETSNIIVEFWEFLCENKKFWLIPILIVFLLLGLVIVFGSSTAAPFIYTLF